MKQSPFTDNYYNAKRLFKRFHGQKFAVEQGGNVLDFIVPYEMCKISSVEIIGGTSLDTASLEVLDTEAGTISGVSNAKLGQFAFDVNISQGFSAAESSYCTDLIQGLIIRITYTSSTNKTIGINYVLHEEKDN